MGPRLLALPLLCVLAVAADSLAGPGDRERGFGSRGVTTLPAGSSGNLSDLLVQDDGKIVVSGRVRSGRSASIARYTRDGRPDRGFGSDGAVTLAGTNDVAALAEAPGGRIVAVADLDDVSRIAQEEEDPPIEDPPPERPEGFMVVRLLPDGSLDPSFGSGGVVRHVRFGRNPAGVAVLADGRVLVGGDHDRFQPANRGAHWIVARLNPDGSVDESYGRGGFYTGRMDTPSADVFRAPKMIGLRDGSVVLYAIAARSQQVLETRLFRVDPQGNADGDFNAAAPPFVADGRPILGLDLAETRGGGVAVAGRTNETYPAAVVAGVTASGAPQPGFGPRGVLVLARRLHRPGIAFLESVAVDGRGRIVVGGGVGSSRRRNRPPAGWLLARLRPNGSLDRSFGRRGLAVHRDLLGRPKPIGSPFVQELDVHGGSIVAGGYVSGTTGRLGIARFGG